MALQAEPSCGSAGSTRSKRRLEAGRGTLSLTQLRLACLLLKESLQAEQLLLLLPQEARPSAAVSAAQQSHSASGTRPPAGLQLLLQKEISPAFWHTWAGADEEEKSGERENCLPPL